MEVRKVFRAGNSLVISLPQEMLRELELTEGSRVAVSVDRQRGEIVLRPFTGADGSGIAGDFAKQVEEFINEYAGVLRELKK
ncbi:putative addiction module antidote [Thermodesulfitimonas autotrophica]|uniref:Putative addiction module antidote n=1 Tax=Thermodesulfitimonas autotrophica TaxID=1894989 RepID=A0A3N5BC01_9THEO|nr:AbrB/MazE/SpoVT family DNA-binding domain-containing protein [Thermodesulfitimonas autotrophica]RPF47158.1 putative addiction module antidote [Thermodesulfitimonas autotrophica]